MTDQSVEARMRSAKSPQDGFLILARAIDELREAVVTKYTEYVPPWNAGWDTAPIGTPEETFTPHEAMQVATFGDTTEVTLPVVGEEVRRARREFAKQYLHLIESEGFDGQVDWEDAYSKGGPLWLHAEAREHVMRLPYGTRQAMVVDVQQNGTLQEAVDLGADILKQSGEEGPGSPAMQIGQQLGGGGE